jgi:hypothetical protein
VAASDAISVDEREIWTATKSPHPAVDGPIAIREHDVGQKVVAAAGRGSPRRT